jgi:tetratricopeptide (TPR) repeat protein
MGLRRGFLTLLALVLLITPALRADEQEAQERKLKLLKEADKLRGKGLFAKSIAAYRKAMTLSKEPAEHKAILFEIGRVYEVMERYPAALAAYRKADMRHAEAGLLLKLKKYNQAMDVFRSMGNPVGVGICHELLENENAARIAFEGAGAHGRLGALYMKQKKAGLALEAFEKAKDLEGIAKACDVLGDKEKAASARRQIIEEKNKQIKESLKRLEKNPKEAAEYRILASLYAPVGEAFFGLELYKKSYETYKLACENASKYKRIVTRNGRHKFMREWLHREKFEDWLKHIRKRRDAARRKWKKHGT